MLRGRENLTRNVEIQAWYFPHHSVGGYRNRRGENTTSIHHRFACSKLARKRQKVKMWKLENFAGRWWGTQRRCNKP